MLLVVTVSEDCNEVQVSNKSIMGAHSSKVFAENRIWDSSVNTAIKNHDSLRLLSMLKLDPQLAFVEDPNTRQLPVHVALIQQAESALILELLKIQPLATSHADFRGLLPIHYAVMHHASADIITTLLLQFPEAVGIADDNGMCPCHLAAK